MLLTNKTYDILKWIAQYFLPALGTLYFALAAIWGFPYGEEVVGTITAIDTFLGVILGISSATYKGDGVIQVDTSAEDKDIYRLVLNQPIENLPEKSSVILKVDPSKEGMDE